MRVPFSWRRWISDYLFLIGVFRQQEIVPLFALLKLHDDKFIQLGPNYPLNLNQFEVKGHLGFVYSTKRGLLQRAITVPMN